MRTTRSRTKKDSDESPSIPTTIKKIKALPKPVATPEEIALAQSMYTDNASFMKDLAIATAKYIAQVLIKPDDNAYLAYSTPVLKQLWRIYPDGLSYKINYYMYKKSIDKIETEADLIHQDFEKLIEALIDNYVKTPEFQRKLVEKNAQMLSKYDAKWTDIKITNGYDLRMSNGDTVSETLAKSLEKAPLQKKLNIFVKFFKESFKNHEIAQSSQQGMTLFRGVTGFNIENDTYKTLLAPSTSFLSTSTDETVALAHTEYMPGKVTLNNDERDRVILEMHLEPGIKFIDYNSLAPTDTSNGWQKEFILPPGLHFVEKEIKHVKRIDTITVKTPLMAKSKKAIAPPATKTVESEYDILVVEVRAQASSGGSKINKK